MYKLVKDISHWDLVTESHCAAQAALELTKKPQTGTTLPAPAS